MKLLMKFVLANIKQSKIRLLLILLSISLSTALFITASALGANIEQVYLNENKQHNGETDITVKANGDNDSVFFDESEFEPYKEYIDYQVGLQSVQTHFEITSNHVVTSSLYGYNMNEAIDMKALSLDTYLEGVEFTKDYIIISKLSADKGNYKLNDKIEYRVMIPTFDGDEVVYEEQLMEFTIYGIAKNTGMFLRDSGYFHGMITDELADSLLMAEGKISYLFIKVREEANLTTKEFKSLLKKELPEFDYIHATNYEYIKEQVRSLTDIIQLVVSLVVIMSSFIIYSCFKVIVVERISLIGTLRSIGASKKMSHFIMLVETFVYGLIGGILGSGMGIVVLSFMTNIFAYNEYTKQRIEFHLIINVWHFIFGIGLAIALSLLSGLVPIYRSTRFTIKEIMAGHVEEDNKMNYIGVVLGSVLLGMSAIIPLMFNLRNNLPLSIVAIFANVLAVILLTPIIAKIVLKSLLKVLSRNLHKRKLMYMAIKNILGSRKLLNNITLLVVGLSISLSINTITRSVADDILNYYEKATYDIRGYLQQFNDEKLERMKQVEGVEDILVYHYNYASSVNGSDYGVAVIGSELNSYFDYLGIDFISEKDKTIQKSKEGRYIIVNKTVLDTHQLEVGDMMTLTMNNEEFEFQIIGIVNTMMESGQSVFIDEQHVAGHGDLNRNPRFLIKSAIEPYDLKVNLVESFRGEDGSLTLISEDIEREKQYNNQLFSIISWVSLLTLLIGSVGIFNNYVATMMSRKRELAVYRAIGMSVSQMKRTLLNEAILCGVISSIVGILSCGMFLWLTYYLIHAMQMVIEFFIYPRLLLAVIVGGVVISVISSFSAYLQTGKWSIIESIMYE